MKVGDRVMTSDGPGTIMSISDHGYAQVQIDGDGVQKYPVRRLRAA